MELTREERETIIRCDANHKEWQISTADDMFKRKLAGLGFTPEENRLEPYSFYTVPFHLVALKHKRTPSPKQLEQLKEIRGKVKYRRTA